MTIRRPERDTAPGDLRPQVPAVAADAAGQVLLTKLSVPVIRADLVHRSRLDELLERAMVHRLTLVDAPAGWGKTTLVGDWLARCRPAPTAWLSLDPDDGDSLRFWSYVIEACRTVHPSLGGGALELLQPPGAPPVVGALPALVNELLLSGQPLVLVLDDYHVITNNDIHREVAFLVDHLPPNVHLVVVTRSDPPLPIARWRVRGDVFEIRADELRFDADDAAVLLNDRLRLGLAEDSVAALHKRTEGWVAGMHLAALSLQRHPDRDTFIDGFAGDDRHIVDYLGSEVLDGLPDETRVFLLRTSILDRLTGPLCDAVAGTNGSDRLLADIERVNHFLIPLDTRGGWYRYHQLFGELLRLELQRSGATVDELHRRAATWLLRNGFVADAIRHITLARDEAEAADLIAEHWASFLQRGDVSAVIGWLDALGDDAVRTDPRLCLIRAWMAINIGCIDDLPDWIDAADEAAKAWPGQAALTFTAAAAMLRCIAEYLSGDAGAAIATAREAQALAAEEIAPWRSVGCPVLGIALFWTGDVEQSSATLRAALPRAERAGNHLAVTHALGCLALAAARQGDLATAQALADQAVANSEDNGFRRHWTNAMAYLAEATTRLARGDLDGASEPLERAVELSRGGLARIELVYGLVTLADIALRVGDRLKAVELLAEAQRAIDRCPDPGIVTALTGDLAERVTPRSRPPTHSADHDGGLTAHELGVLALLPSALTLREIAGRRYVSLNTVKSQTRAIYRKLGVSGRDEAVARARQLGLA